MLNRLSGALREIASDMASEEDIYRRERMYAMPRTRGGQRGRLAARRGDGVLLCPICGTQANRFLPFGLSGRRNAQCPGCGSLERHRFLWIYLFRRTRLCRRRLTVLHTAPEAFLESRFRALGHWRYTTMDRFNPFADCRADLVDAPFPSQSLDLILSCHVLEHIRDDGSAMAQMARMLRPGGTAIVLVPFDPKRPVSEEGRDVVSAMERLVRFGHPFHYRIYGADFVNRMEAAGFAIETFSSRRLLSAHQRRRHRVNTNYLFHCTRV